jgi:hypothetical protein
MSTRGRPSCGPNCSKSRDNARISTRTCSGSASNSGSNSSPISTAHLTLGIWHGLHMMSATYHGSHPTGMCFGEGPEDRIERWRRTSWGGRSRNTATPPTRSKRIYAPSLWLSFTLRCLLQVIEAITSVSNQRPWEPPSQAEHGPSPQPEMKCNGGPEN